MEYIKEKGKKHLRTSDRSLRVWSYLGLFSHLSNAVSISQLVLVQSKKNKILDDIIHCKNNNNKYPR